MRNDDKQREQCAQQGQGDGRAYEAQQRRAFSHRPIRISLQMQVARNLQTR